MKEDMLRLKTESIEIRLPRTRRDWIAALRNVGDVANMTESFFDARVAVDDARAAFVAEAKKFKMPLDEYEFNTSIANVLFGSGFHRDRKGEVHRLADLISLDYPRIGDEEGRRCIRFSIATRLEDGLSTTSRETLEWLHNDGLVAQGCYADRHPEAYVEISRVLDAYMTDVEKVVRTKLDRIVQHFLDKKEVA